MPVTTAPSRISVRVGLHATLAKYRPDPANREPFVVGVDAGACVADAAAACGVPEDKRALVMVDGKRASADTVLNDGAFVQMFPPMAGG